MFGPSICWERVGGEPFRLGSRDFADELVGCETLEGLEPAGEVVGRDEVGKVLPELIVAIVVEALDGGVLDSPVHPLHLAIGPRVLCLGRAMLDIVPGAGEFESMGSEEFTVGDRLLDERNG